MRILTGVGALRLLTIRHSMVISLRRIARYAIDRTELTQRTSTPSLVAENLSRQTNPRRQGDHWVP